MSREGDLYVWGRAFDQDGWAMDTKQPWIAATGIADKGWMSGMIQSEGCGERVFSTIETSLERDLTASTGQRPELPKALQGGREWLWGKFTGWCVCVQNLELYHPHPKLVFPLDWVLGIWSSASPYTLLWIETNHIHLKLPPINSSLIQETFVRGSMTPQEWCKPLDSQKVSIWKLFEARSLFPFWPVTWRREIAMWRPCVGLALCNLTRDQTFLTPGVFWGPGIFETYPPQKSEDYLKLWNIGPEKSWLKDYFATLCGRISSGAKLVYGPRYLWGENHHGQCARDPQGGGSSSQECQGWYFGCLDMWISSSFLSLCAACGKICLIHPKFMHARVEMASNHWSIRDLHHLSLPPGAGTSTSPCSWWPSRSSKLACGLW